MSAPDRREMLDRALDTPIQGRGKYLLKVEFGEAKSEDNVIEMPIIVGQEDLK